MKAHVMPIITAHLKERGLELSTEKTKITQIDKGFDFLGQNIRKYKNGMIRKLLIKPSEKNTNSFLDKGARNNQTKSDNESRRVDKNTQPDYSRLGKLSSAY